MNFDEKTTLFEAIEASKQAGQMSENMLYLLSTLLANTAQVTKHKIRSINELPQNSVAVSENLFFTSSESGAKIVSFEGEVPSKIPEILPKKFREIIVIFDSDDDEEEPKEKKKKVLKVCRVKFDRNLSNIMDVFPYNNKQWPTEAINYAVEFGTSLIIDRLFVLDAADEDKMHQIYSKKEPSSSPYYLVNALSQHFSVRMEQLKDKSGIVLHDDANESQAAKELRNFRVLTAMLMMDAKMQQFDKVASNMYQNGISTDSIDTTVEGFEDLESQKEFDGRCTMFELGRTIENIRINFDKLRKTLSDEVCKILTKLFKENNPPRKEKATEVKRKKDFTYVEYIQ
jgi:hypothetical protein